MASEKSIEVTQEMIGAGIGRLIDLKYSAHNVNSPKRFFDPCTLNESPLPMLEIGQQVGIYIYGRNLVGVVKAIK